MWQTFTSSWKGRGYYLGEGILMGFLALALVVYVSIDLTPQVRTAFLVSVATVGILPVLWSAYRALRLREITVDLLAGVALIFALLGREWSSAIFVGLMLSAARVMTHWNDARTEQNLSGLMHLRPERARVRRKGTVLEVAVTEIVIGDLVLCEVGSRIPIDGRVQAGEATIDEASLTGESLPVEKSVGSLVLSSTLVVSGSLEIQATRVGRDTTFEKIIILVEQARMDKPAISTFAQKFGKIYILSIFLVAAGLWIWTQDLNLILAVALVVCADDVAIAIPLAYISAIGNAAKRGVIIKGGRYLEAMGQATTLIFDKTGTITQGKLMVEQVLVLGGVTEGQLRAYVQCLGERSEHPVAKALARIPRTSDSVTVEDDDLVNFEELRGKGLRGTFGSHTLVVGRVALLRDERITFSVEHQQKLQSLEREGKSVVCVAMDGAVVGLVVMVDALRPQVKETLEKLRRLGIKRLVMLTGDNSAVAAQVAQAVGIDECYAELLPEQKLAHVERLTTESGVSVMVGDGVNDAASLERSTVGIAMGAIGTAAAIDSANIVLMRDDISRLPELIELSHSLKGVVQQNFWIWGTSNVVGLGLVFAGIIGPVGAAAYNFLSDFIPLLNSLKVVRLWLGKSE